jgi:hypothetical protein
MTDRRIHLGIHAAIILIIKSTIAALAFYIGLLMTVRMAIVFFDRFTRSPLLWVSLTGEVMLSAFTGAFDALITPTNLIPFAQIWIGWTLAAAIIAAIVGHIINFIIY